MTFFCLLQTHTSIVGVTKIESFRALTSIKVIGGFVVDTIIFFRRSVKIGIILFDSGGTWRFV